MWMVGDLSQHFCQNFQEKSYNTCIYIIQKSVVVFKLYGPDVMYVNFPKNTPVLNLSLPVVFLDACMGNLF